MTEREIAILLIEKARRLISETGVFLGSFVTMDQAQEWTARQKDVEAITKVDQIFQELTAVEPGSTRYDVKRLLYWQTALYHHVLENVVSGIEAQYKIEKQSAVEQLLNDLEAAAMEVKAEESEDKAQTKVQDVIGFPGPHVGSC